MSQDEVIIFLQRSFKVVRQPQRRALVIKLHPDKGNQILTNMSVPQKVISEFLLSKATWLEKNLTKLEAYRASYIIPEFKEGQLFPFFGEMKYFKMVSSPAKKIRFSVEEGFLICYVPADFILDKSGLSQLQLQLVRFYKRQAQDYLIKRGHFLSQLTGLIPSQIKIQTARTRWGSCNSKKIINLNWKLIVFANTLIDYVIIHELSHLKHMDHSQNFWKLVQQHSPNYEELKANLKQQTTIAAFLDLI